MSIVSPQSLAKTVDTVNEAFFLGRSLSPGERKEAALWIAGRQGLPGAYGNMFAPTPAESRESLVLFTGEKVQAGGGARHILGEEACRALILLGVGDPGVKAALERASDGMLRRVPKDPRLYNEGIYCCARCSVALWRHLAVGGLQEANPERLLAAGLRTLRNHRDSQGRWRRFPFYYTLLALSDIDLPEAQRELEYARPGGERALARTGGKEPYAHRRRELLTRILGRGR